MSQALPDWRSFSSRAPGSGPTDPDADGGSTDRSDRRRILAVAALGGVATASLIVAAAVGALLFLGTARPGGVADPTGDPFTTSPEGVGRDAGLMVSSGSEAYDADEIVVDLAGAVMRPGLHRLRTGDRVGDAVEAGGGFAPRVDLAAAAESLNLAEPLEDGMKILVPELGRGGPREAGRDARLIDINRADQATLETLPGIGPVTAAKIMAARDEARFGSVEELRSRGIVGEAVFEQIRDLVRASR